MILSIYLQGRELGTVRGSARYVTRVARRAARLHPGCRAVFQCDDDLTADQISVLNAIADDNERACLQLLESGYEPAHL